MIGNLQRDKRTAWLCLAAILAVLWGFNPGVLMGAGPAPSEAKLIRLKACAAHQADYERIIAAGKGNANLQAFQKRLDRLDAVTGSVLSDLAVHQAAYVSRTVATVGPGSDKPLGKPTGALKLLNSYQEEFSAELPLAGEADRKTLEAYYSAAAAALADVVFARAQKLIRGEDAAEIQRLAIVLPLLNCPEERWSQRQVDELPAWIKRPEALRIAEELALRAKRPRTAYSLARAAKGPTTAPSQDKAYVDYLEKGADLMLRSKDYPTGLFHLRAALQAAQTAKLTQRSSELRFRLIEVIHDTGSAKEAADNMLQFLGEAPDANSYGKAAMLRLKYLYEAENFKQVLVEAARLQKDERCAPYLPQILYVAWASSRREDFTSAAADQWRQVFLERFPDHSLGADMYFASAMNSLAGGKYDEALRILQFIEHRYPSAKIIPKVKEIEQKLARNGSPATMPAATPAGR